ncbi:MAG: hypothetical protein EOO24_50430, partial [Comamonadaceae bacterium]
MAEARRQPAFSGFTAVGGSGATGGNGGVVTVSAASDVTIQTIEVRGGDGASGGAGGAGGIAGIVFGGALAIDAIGAGGGSGGAGVESGAGGTGGVGGTISLTRSSGDFTLASAPLLEANGGQGGDAQAESSGVSGFGGDGGLVYLAATDGRVILQSPSVTAAGGLGGLQTDGSPGVPGAMGQFSAAGSAVNVEGSFNLDAQWVNGAVVNMRDASEVYGDGTFTNLGFVNLYDSASLSPSNLVQNMTDARISVFGADVRTTLRENFGKVEVAAGAQLTAAQFNNNAGLLQVDGTLRVGSLPVARMSTFAAATGSFTNASSGLITGNGTISLSDGAGTLYNYGTIAPAGVGTIGTLALQGGLVMEPGSTLAIDIGADRSHDVLDVSGNTVSGGRISVNYLDGTTFSQGDRFDVLQTASLD